MTWAAFLALLVSVWGVHLDVHPWFQDQVPVIEFVDAASIGGYPVCGTVVLGWMPDDESKRWVERLNLVQPDSVWYCPHDLAPEFVNHELWCHVHPHILDNDPNLDHSRGDCGPIVLPLKPVLNELR
jgi:hypothetical protein